MSDAKPKVGNVVVIVFGLVGLLGAGFGGYMLARGGPAEATVEDAAPEEGEVVEVGTLTVTLAGTDARYARVGLAVVLAEGVAEDDVVGRFALVKDAAISTVAGHSPDDFRSANGLEGLRRSLSQVVRDLYPDGQVVRVVLTEAIVT